jgi:hypothetical protein
MGKALQQKIIITRRGGINIQYSMIGERGKALQQ